MEVRVVLFFNDTATTEIYTLSLHDALPIYLGEDLFKHKPLSNWHSKLDLSLVFLVQAHESCSLEDRIVGGQGIRSEEHTSELQSRQYLVCRLLLEKKTNNAHRDTKTRITHD